MKNNTICFFQSFMMIFFCHFSQAQNVGIGTTIPAAKLHVKGTANAPQLIVEANSIQSNTNPLIKLKDNSGNDLLWIHSDHPSNTFVGINTGKENAGSLGIATRNTFIGKDAGFSNTVGAANTAIGTSALNLNTVGERNTATGSNSLRANLTGHENCAFGVDALGDNIAGSKNTAIGNNALSFQSYNPGFEWETANVAVGYNALTFNQPTSTSNGMSNTAIGSYALYNNSIGFDNTALGAGALYSNGQGKENTGIGRQALFYNSYGIRNVAIGYKALRSNNSGDLNTANGSFALYSNNASNNTGIGAAALYNSLGENNTAVGYSSLIDLGVGNYNTALGAFSGNFVTTPNLNNTVSIGNATFLNTLSNYACFGGTSTTWNGGNVAWLTYSDARIKNNIQEDVKGLDFITRLRPVTYYRSLKAMMEITGNKEMADYPGKYDIEKIKFSGFLAQEVEQAARNTNYNFNGVVPPTNSHELYSMSYELFVVPLVKAVQELNAINAKLVKRIELLESLLVTKEK